jgi:ribose-phosphate pyrophosphokinase
VAHEAFKFPAGEVHVRCSRFIEGIENPIRARIKNSDDFFLLAMFADAQRRLWGPRQSAFLPYMPYARQDRVAVDGEPLSIKVFATLLNSLDFERVITFDPQSDVVAAVVDRLEVISPREYIRKILKDRIIPMHGENSVLLVSPDAGQDKKIHNLHLGLPVLQGLKHRDVATGKLSGFNVVDRNAPLSKVCVIIDDIIDGGGTFIGLADVLRDCGATHVYLICSHGIFSKGTDLAYRFDHVFVTDSYQDPPKHPNITGYCVAPSDIPENRFYLFPRS